MQRIAMATPRDHLAGSCLLAHPILLRCDSSIAFEGHSCSHTPFCSGATAIPSSQLAHPSPPACTPPGSRRRRCSVSLGDRLNSNTEGSSHTPFLRLWGVHPTRMPSLQLARHPGTKKARTPRRHAGSYSMEFEYSDRLVVHVIIHRIVVEIETFGRLAKAVVDIIRIKLP